MCTQKNCSKIQSVPSPSPTLAPTLQTERYSGCPLPSAFHPWLSRTISLERAGAPEVTFGNSDLHLSSFSPPHHSGAHGLGRWARAGRWLTLAPSSRACLPSPHSPWAMVVPHFSLPQPQYFSSRNQKHPSRGCLTTPHNSPPPTLSLAL